MEYLTILEMTAYILINTEDIIILMGKAKMERIIVLIQNIIDGITLFSIQINMNHGGE